MPIRLNAKKVKGKAWQALLSKKTSDTVIVPKAKKKAQATRAQTPRRSNAK